MTTTTTTEPVTATLEVPGATLTYDVRRNGQRQRAAAVPDRLADGRRRLPEPRRPLHRPHGVTYDPRGIRAERQDRSCEPITPEIQADDVHRVIEEVGAAGRPVREQRRCDHRARARRRCIRTTSGRSSRTSRRSRRSCPTRVRARPRARPSTTRTRRSGCGRRDGPLHRCGEPSAVRSPPRSSRSRRPIRRCSACRPRTTATATDPMLGTGAAALHALRARLRGPRVAAHDAGRAGRRRGVQGRAGAARRVRGRRAARHRGRSCSPATTAGSWAASTASTGKPAEFAAKLREVLAAS